MAYETAVQVSGSGQAGCCVNPGAALSPHLPWTHTHPYPLIQAVYSVKTQQLHQSQQVGVLENHATMQSCQHKQVGAALCMCILRLYTCAKGASQPDASLILIWPCLKIPAPTSHQLQPTQEA